MHAALRLSLALCLVAAAPAIAEDDHYKDLLAEIEALRNEVHELKAATESRSLSEAADAAAGRLLQAESLKNLALAADNSWLVICGTLVMFMHAGFAMLETGSCRAKNASNVLLKNLLNVCIGTYAWYATGFAFAYGGPYDKDDDLDNGFIGTEKFGGKDFYKTDSDGNITPSGDNLAWFFQWAFCTAAATIVSGGVAERVSTPFYALYSLLMAGFIYPVIVAWTWGYGWLEDYDDVGYMDFAGSGIVHLTGGVSALVGAAILGPRKGRFENPEEFEPHSLPLVALGTLALWFGWYGFNCGSTLGMSEGQGPMAAHVAMTTTLSAASGGLVTFLLAFAMTRKYQVGAICNGILAGLVSITAPCGNVDFGSAFWIGIIGAFVYTGSSAMLKKLKIDDPVDASPVHGFCGIWGVLAAALFDFGQLEKPFDGFHGWSGFGCMTNDDGSCQTAIWGKVFGVQILLICCVLAWAGGWSALIFGVLRATGMLRISESVEEEGIDAAKHSPMSAYNMGDGAAPGKTSMTSVVPNGNGKAQTSQTQVEAWNGPA